MPSSYNSASLLQLNTLPPHPEKPEWANLVAKISVDPVPPSLCGPGLYALFLDDALFYIGLHVGDNAEPDLPVLERWKLHVVGQTLRAKAISFSPGPLNEVLRTIQPSSMVDDLARHLPDGRDTDCRQLKKHALVSGSHCNAKKAAFASANWETLKPGNEDTLLGRITCLFQPIPEGWQASLDGAIGKERGKWVREMWLRPAETALVDRFHPICNACTEVDVHVKGASSERVARDMGAIFPQTLPAFDRTTFDALVAARSAARRKLVDAYAAVPGLSPPDEVELALAEEEGLSRGEFTLRRRFSPPAAALVDALISQCPTLLETRFNDTPDFRIRVGNGGRVLLLLSTAHRGQLRCHTTASVAACEALGFPEPVSANKPMAATFTFDPATVEPERIFALAQAAREALGV